MAYTEVKERNGKKYFYRVRTRRIGKKFKKERIYLGKDLIKEELELKEKNADIKLNPDKIKKKEEIKEFIPKIKQILKKYNVKKAGIFGSYARGEQNKKSDIDILIEYPKGIGLGAITIRDELQEKLGRKVDLVSYRYISPYIKEKAFADEVRII